MKNTRQEIVDEFKKSISPKDVAKLYKRQIKIRGLRDNYIGK